jgi:hypothetical protein
VRRTRGTARSLGRRDCQLRRLAVLPVQPEPSRRGGALAERGSRVSYEATRRGVPASGLPTTEHRRHERLNNRAEDSHLPARKRERVLRRLKSAEHAQGLSDGTTSAVFRRRVRRRAAARSGPVATGSDRSRRVASARASAGRACDADGPRCNGGRTRRGPTLDGARSGRSDGPSALAGASRWRVRRSRSHAAIEWAWRWRRCRYGGVWLDAWARWA